MPEEPAPEPPPTEREIARRGLEDVWPDLEIVDEDLELERGRVDLVGVDLHGRLVLIGLGTDAGAGVDPLHFVSEALAFAESNRDLLAQHFGHPRLARGVPPADPIAAWIAPAIPREERVRMEALRPGRVRLFELRRLCSRRAGERTYVVPLWPVEAPEAPGADGSPVEPAGTVQTRAFTRRVAGDLRSLAERLIARVSRVDDEIRLETENGELLWRLNDALLCSLRAEGGCLTGLVPPGEKADRIADARAAEDFLARVLGRSVELLRLCRRSGSNSNQPPLSREDIEAFRS